MPDPVYACDVLGIFDRNGTYVVRVRRPGRSCEEAEIEEKDLRTFAGQWKIAQNSGEEYVELDISMLGEFVEAE